ncbi:MAG: hypothetical protein ABI615_03800 [Chthoniobacterales bacterium]
MSRMFGLVDSKVQEAEYFLDRILSAEFGFYGVQCDTVAFTASARSITFAMQSSLKGTLEFDAWYSSKQSELRRNPLARFFHEFRRVSQHIGINVVTKGRFSDKKALYYFGVNPELNTVPALDVATACSKYFKTILELVYECYITFPTLINGQWHYTSEFFASNGKNIEDAEESLGFPRGWSAVSGLDEKTRWRYLRKEADGCNIQSQFQQWLKKTVPHPDDEI